MSDCFSLFTKCKTDNRPRFGVWGGRFFVSVCIGGYGVSLGALAKPYKRDDLLPVRPFRNAAYRGWGAAAVPVERGEQDA